MKVYSKVLGYLKQPSTWRGLIAIATTAGVVINSEQTEAIIVAGVGLVALVEVFRNEKQTEI